MQRGARPCWVRAQSRRRRGRAGSGRARSRAGRGRGGVRECCPQSPTGPTPAARGRSGICGAQRARHPPLRPWASLPAPFPARSAGHPASTAGARREGTAAAAARWWSEGAGRSRPGARARAVSAAAPSSRRPCAWWRAWRWRTSRQRCGGGPCRRWRRRESSVERGRRPWGGACATGAPPGPGSACPTAAPRAQTAGPGPRRRE